MDEDKRVKKRLSRLATPADESSLDEPVYCICKKPDNGRWMIGCDFCDDWFHGSCIGMNEGKADLVIKFACPLCIAKGSVGVWKRKCRLPECQKPIAGRSKYCSEEHAKVFLQMVVGQKLAGVSRSDLQQLVSRCSLKEFQALGSHLETSSQDQVSQEPNGGQSSIKQRLEALAAAKERVKKLNEMLAERAGVKKRDICGFDFRLLDDRWTEPGFLTQLVDDEELVCQKERRKCLKHTGWYNIFVDMANLDTVSPEPSAAI